MAERARVEIGFSGGPGFTGSVDAGDADALEAALAAGKGGAVVLHGEDGQVTVAVSQVTYVRRIARESRVGFGSV